MIQTISFSKPTSSCQEKLGRPYIKARITAKKQASSPEDKNCQLELFTEKQAFQQNMTESQAMNFFNENAGTTFKNAVCRTEKEEITVMANRHGEIKKTSRPIKQISKNNKAADSTSSAAKNIRNTIPGIALSNAQTAPQTDSYNCTSASASASASATDCTSFQIQSISFNKKKNYILKEGIPVPFLVKLGVMTKDGKVIAQKYDKYRQINRFLEFIRDVVPEITKQCAPDGKTFTEDRPLYVADFGCGKSYLTFAVHYYLNTICGIPVSITGLDLKEDVIKRCENLAQELNCQGLHFYCGDVAQAKDKYRNSPDLMITLHACDTATDYALNYAINEKTCTILSVPCCQHEINLQLEKQTISAESPFATLEHWGILRERFSALATDAIRAELLEQQGYSVQLLEFIDFEGTPKNLLIRAVKKTSSSCETGAENSKKRLDALRTQLNAKQTLFNLLNN